MLLPKLANEVDGPVNGVANLALEAAAEPLTSANIHPNA